MNLNYEGSDFSLCSNRRNVLEICLEKLRELTKGKSGTWSRTVLQKMLKSYENKDKEGKYREYSGIVIWYLKKKLKA